MLNRGLVQFAGKRILLLQGPVGPFFTRLSKDLRNVGAQVFKVNFNGGDWFFYPNDAFNYRGTMEEWPVWCEELIRQLDIEVVLLFGDCRPIHRVAHRIAQRHGLEIGVFEEGYLRPDYITFERVGVNAFSRLPRDPNSYQGAPPPVPPRRSVGNTYWSMLWCGFRYFTASAIGRLWFRNYRHHRPIGFMEAFPWAISLWRKLWYRATEWTVQEELISRWNGRYFLVPLQVFNDVQITVHSDVKKVEHFIEDTIRSFAQHAPAHTLLVFKHHPMDRGYRDYTALISRVARKAMVGKRVRYIHDQHLPTLLEHARGVVVVNSTVGLSALSHGAPTKVCGKAIYDIPGLTYQGPLSRFWRDAPNALPDGQLFTRFRSHLVAQSQLNGSFYKPMEIPGSNVGVVWRAFPEPLKAIEAVADKDTSKAA